MSYRPQFALPAAPRGFAWQPCVYQFDRTNTPSLALLPSSGQETGDIPLPLDHDAQFYLQAVRIISDGINVQLYDPWTDDLMDEYLDPQEYAQQFPPSVLESGAGLTMPAGAVFRCRLQGQ